MKPTCFPHYMLRKVKVQMTMWHLRSTSIPHTLTVNQPEDEKRQTKIGCKFVVACLRV